MTSTTQSARITLAKALRRVRKWSVASQKICVIQHTIIFLMQSKFLSFIEVDLIIVKMVNWSPEYAWHYTTGRYASFKHLNDQTTCNEYNPPYKVQSGALEPTMKTHVKSGTTEDTSCCTFKEVQKMINWKKIL